MVFTISWNEKNIAWKKSEVNQAKLSSLYSQHDKFLDKNWFEPIVKHWNPMKRTKCFETKNLFCESELFCGSSQLKPSAQHQFSSNSNQFAYFWFVCFQLHLFSTMQGLNNWSWKQTNVGFEAFLAGNQGRDDA